MKRFNIHCYCTDKKDDWTFPECPVNSYTTDSEEKLIDCIKSIIQNDISGIGKIVIQDNNYEQTDNIGFCDPRDLDRERV